MKKFLSTAFFLVAALLARGQGTVVFNNISSVYLVRTNITYYFGVPMEAQTNRGVIPKTANSFYFALLISPYTGTPPSSNPLDSAWTFQLMATNSTLAAGGIAGPGSSAGAVAPDWGAPTGSFYTSSERNYYMIVGWSANLGNSWAAISAHIADGFSSWNWEPGIPWYGQSGIGNGYSGGGPSSLAAPSLFGVSTPMPGGLTSGFDLYPMIPEPSVLALGALGTLILIRRRMFVRRGEDARFSA